MNVHLQRTLIVVGVYILWMIFVYVRQACRQRGRKFNSRSTGDEVLQDVDLTGKHAIITGCSGGLGQETARCMVAKGCTVILANRNQTKSAAAKEAIINTFEESLKREEVGSRLVLMEIDLSSLESVRKFAQECVANGVKCDYLICNAGIMALPEYRTTKDGIEMQFGVNHIGHWYLTRLLLEPIFIPSKTRVISISSYGHRFASYNRYNELMDVCLKEKTFMGSRKGDYAPMYNYGISKGSNILFARQLNRDYNKDGIVAVSAHPGFIMGTDLARDTGNEWGPTFRMLGMVFCGSYFITQNKSIPQGVSNVLRCVAMSDEEIEPGEYYCNCVPARLDNEIKGCAVIRGDDDTLAKKLDQLSEVIVQELGFDLKLNVESA